MTIEIPEFDINGYYLLDGRKSKHDGKVSLYPDGKLLGGIYTHNSDGSKYTRLLVGLYDREASSVQFLKVPFPGQRLVPVLYSLTSETLSDGRFPIGDYRGFWLDIPIPMIMPIANAVSGGEVRVTRELILLPASELRETYFNDELAERIEELGARFRNKGALGFQRCSSLVEMVR